MRPLRRRILPRELGRQLGLVRVKRHELASSAHDRVDHPVNVTVVHAHDTEPHAIRTHRCRIRRMHDSRNVVSGPYPATGTVDRLDSCATENFAAPLLPL